MAYHKPGVELTYVQRTLSPNIPTPIFYPIVVGEGYFVATVPKPTNLQESTAVTVSGTSTAPKNVGALPQYSGITYTASGTNAWTMTGSVYGFGQPVGAGFVLDPNSVVIDIYGTAKCADTLTYAGKVTHLKSGTHFTAASDGSTVTISGAASVVALSGLVGGYVRMGYRLKRTDIVNKVIEYTSVNDIVNLVGKPCVENPLGLGLYIAMLNAGTSVYGLALSGAINSFDTDTVQHSTACDVFAGYEIYVVAPLAQASSVEDVYLSNIQSWGLPENKHERLLFFTRKPSNSLSSAITDKVTFANQVKIDAMDKSERRLFRPFPPVCYVEEEKHLSTMYSGYVRQMWKDNATYEYLAPRLTSNITLTNGQRYFAKQELTDSILDLIAADGGFDYLTVRYPAYGSYVAAGLAGTVAGVPPAQGLTGRTLLGPIAELKYSSDFFSETHLDTMAGGGNWIMTQRGPGAAIKTRHQLSTDTSSVERRECSITKQLDFAGMTIRAAFEPYIGKFNITPEFLKRMGIILNGCKLVLQREGDIYDLSIESITQDTVNRDTILVSIMAAVLYPTNFVRITLAF